MKNLAKFLLFVLLVSAGISLLYDYRLKHGGLNLPSIRKSEKYTLASQPSVDSKQVASLEALNRERRALVSSVLPSVVAVKSAFAANMVLIHSSFFSVISSGDLAIHETRRWCKTRWAPA